MLRLDISTSFSPRGWSPPDSDPGVRACPSFDRCKLVRLPSLPPRAAQPLSARSGPNISAYRPSQRKRKLIEQLFGWLSVALDCDPWPVFTSVKSTIVGAISSTVAPPIRSPPARTRSLRRNQRPKSELDATRLTALTYGRSVPLELRSAKNPSHCFAKTAQSGTVMLTAGLSSPGNSSTIASHSRRSSTEAGSGGESRIFPLLVLLSINTY